MQSTIPVSTPAVVDAFSNESYKIKSFENIGYDNIAALDARIRAIEGVGLYDHV